MTTWIEAFNVGWFTTPAGMMRRDDPLDQPARFPIPAYVIVTGEHRILVDTGLHPSAVADAAAYYDGADAMSIFTLEQQARSAQRLRELRDAGLTVLPGHDPDVLMPGPIAAAAR